MIAYIEGRLAEVWGNACLVVTEGGVGYEVALPAHTLAALPGKGGSVALYTSLAVREDALELFGFASFEERQTFEVLVSISKVGARTALAILSIFRPDDLRRLVLEDDVLALTRVSGIGKKTAQHVFWSSSTSSRWRTRPRPPRCLWADSPARCSGTCWTASPILAMPKRNARLWSKSCCMKSRIWT